MLGPKLVWSQLEEAAASGGIIDEENIARYAAAVSSSFKQVSSARLAELSVFAVQVRVGSFRYYSPPKSVAPGKVVKTLSLPSMTICKSPADIDGSDALQPVYRA
jgi:hypothetical protein